MSIIKNIITGLFILHFSVIVYHICAKHEILQGENITSKYIDPYFLQEWEMFAPPPTGNTRLMYRYVLFSDGRTDTSAFKEILQPLYKKQLNKFYSLSRLSYYLFNCTQNIYANYEYFVNHLPDSVSRSNTDQVRKYVNNKMEQSYSHQSLLKHGLLVFKANYTGIKYDSVLFSYHILDEPIAGFENSNARVTKSKDEPAFAWNSRMCKLNE